MNKYFILASSFILFFGCSSSKPSSPGGNPRQGPGPGSTAIFAGAGDIGVSGANPEDTAKLLDSIVSKDAEAVVFTAGDNAYSDGTMSDYLSYYDPTWGRHKARTKPVPGNHEYHTANAAGYRQYFGFDSDPSVPLYYSFDLGDWHILMLDGEIAIDASSDQVKWVKQDLAAHTNKCVAAIWHEPLYCSGTTHGGSSAKQDVFQALYDAGAELVINGHEHLYERFAPQDANGNLDNAKGIREFVVGTGGAGLYPFGTPVANSEFRENTKHGILKLTLHPTSYEWQFIDTSNTVIDSSVGSGPVDCH